MTMVEISNSPSHPISKEETTEGISLIRNILFEGEREKQDRIVNELESFKEQLREQALREKLNPIVSEHLKDLKEKFPVEFGEVMTDTIRMQVANSKDEVVEALYPILGQMIKRYVQSEIKKWLETFDRRGKNTQSTKQKRRFLGLFGRKSKTQENTSLLAQQYKQVEGIFIVEKGTGFILADHSVKKGESREVFIGLLTALKSYGEDALDSKKEKLNTVQYDSYHITLNDWYKFYGATFINGPINETFKSHLSDKLNTFVSENLSNINEEPTQATVLDLSNKLKVLISAEQENHTT